MLGYTTIGTKDLEKSTAFYDELLSLVGGKQLMGLDRIKFYGTDAGGAMLRHVRLLRVPNRMIACMCVARDGAGGASCSCG